MFSGEKNERERTAESKMEQNVKCERFLFLGNDHTNLVGNSLYDKFPEKHIKAGKDN